MEDLRQLNDVITENNLEVNILYSNTSNNRIVLVSGCLPYFLLYFICLLSFVLFLLGFLSKQNDSFDITLVQARK
jgi:hypothetical protein